MRRCRVAVLSALLFVLLGAVLVVPAHAALTPEQERQCVDVLANPSAHPANLVAWCRLELGEDGRGRDRAAGVGNGNPPSGSGPAPSGPATPPSGPSTPPSGPGTPPSGPGAGQPSGPGDDCDDDDGDEAHDDDDHDDDDEGDDDD